MSKREEKEKAAFEEAIAENPYDEATRKVFADWLEDHGFDDEAVLQREWAPENMRAAEQWLKELADACSVGSELTVEDLIAAAHAYLDSGADLCLSVDTPRVMLNHPEQFWGVFMVLTGRPVPSEERSAKFITCAC
jgi:uncharacterized protein (TIGR02996 family)